MRENEGKYQSISHVHFRVPEPESELEPKPELEPNTNQNSFLMRSHDDVGLLKKNEYDA